ncbi:MAG: TolC family protein [Lachnospiraceae bacterium]|nr:TolC family protein [Lachnospiraceae bacterium]
MIQNRKIMQISAAAISLLTAAVMGAAVPMTALASSPEFARTSEEWASLQDNILEYSELADLIHEYNITVQNNQYEYNQFVKDYGRSKTDVAEKYRDLADELESEITGEDGTGRVSDYQLELQAKQLREQADDNVEDSRTYQLTYAQAEDSLVQSAQSNFISYYKNQLELEAALETKKTLENTYTLTVAQRQAGTATDADVLDAQEAVLNQETTISNLEQTIENTRQTLIVMCGWQGSDQPQIQQVPEIELSQIDAINLEADQQTALETNYTLRINQIKLENAEDADNKANIQKTIDANKRQIGVSVASAWQSLNTARLSYEQAVSDEAAEERNMTLSQQKWDAGMITRYDYESQQAALVSKKLAIQTAKLELLQALETYRWNVNGLASAE